MKHLKTIFLIISLLAVNQLSAQDDLGSSLSVDITKKIIPRLNLSLEEDFRLRDNLSEVDRFSTTLELSYKPWKFLKLGGAYNLINYNQKVGKYATGIIFLPPVLTVLTALPYLYGSVFRVPTVSE